MGKEVVEKLGQEVTDVMDKYFDSPRPSDRMKLRSELIRISDELTAEAKTGEWDVDASATILEQASRLRKLSVDIMLSPQGTKEPTLSFMDKVKVAFAAYWFGKN